MRTCRTALTLFAVSLLCASPTWARDGSNSPNESKSGDRDSRKGSGGGGESGRGSSGREARSGDKSERSGKKADRDRPGGPKGHARGSDPRKWPDVARPDRNRHGRRCPEGRRDCRESCCNPYGYGSSQDWPFPWDYDDWGFPWPDHPNPGRIDRDEDGIRGSSKNVELRISPLNVEVFVNGIRHGKRGNTRISLASGFWTIQIRADGYLTETLELEIKQGDRYRIERKLRRDPNYHSPTREQHAANH